MANPVGGFLVTAAIIALLHAAYSSYEHFAILKAMGRSDESVRQLPSDLLVEVAVSTLLFIVGVTFYAPPLKEISWASEMRKRTIDEMNSRPSFAGFNHRGPIVFSAPVPVAPIPTQ
ncbi:hypothetical protein FRB99_004889 [Tulasnella sp. 403]|nr:hypothetical protein FRB99_004889 [Tulasnella sp. 403]